MIVLFGFAWLFALIAMVIYLIKGISKKNRPLIKKKLLISAIIMIVSFVGMMLTSTETPEELPQDPQITDRGEEPTEPNTKERADYLILTAKDAAATATEEELQEAIDYLITNYPNYYTNNETMEAVMQKGSLVEYGYKDKDESYARLGMNAVMAVKYVYRQAETVEDEATQIKLEKIGEIITEITGNPIEQKQPEQPVADTQEPAPAEPEKQPEAQPTQEPAPVETLPPAEEPVSIATAPEPVEEPPKVEEAPPTQEETKSAAYIGNSNTKKVHQASCSSVGDIKPHHVVEYSTLDEAKNSGYEPCKRCKPF